MDLRVRVDGGSLSRSNAQHSILLDSVSPIVVWLSDQKVRGSMRSRTVPSQDERTSRAFRQLLVVSTLFFVLSVSALGQSTAGRILGTLTDQSGASVAGATVVVTDTQRGTSRTVTTDESGSY